MQLIAVNVAVVSSRTSPACSPSAGPIYGATEPCRCPLPSMEVVDHHQIARGAIEPVHDGRVIG